MHPERGRVPGRLRGAGAEVLLDGCSVDLADAHGNTADGIHIASCGGTWLALVAGFAGLRDFEGEPRFEPRLPAGWDRLRFRLRLRGRTLEVELTPVATRYRVIDGGAMTIHHRGERLELRGGQELVMTDYDEAVGL